MSDGTSLSLVLDQVSKDKNIERKVLVEALEQAILTAAKKAFGEDREMEATFNEATGRVDLSQIIIVADPVTQPPGDEQRHGVGQQVGAGHPDHAVDVGMQVADDRRRRDADDRGVDQDHEEAEAQCEERRPRAHVGGHLVAHGSLGSHDSSQHPAADNDSPAGRMTP